MHTLFIDGRWVDSADHLEPLAVIDPATGEPFEDEASVLKTVVQFHGE